MLGASLLIPLVALLSPVAAHSTPSTPEEAARLADIRERAWRCAPEMAALLEERKRSNQAILNMPAATDASTMFLNSDSAEPKQKTLVCSETSEATIKNHTCVLAPEVTQGPYYHTVGHPIRQNMAENQLGILWLMDVGVIDVNTCKPVPNILVDLWHANATGHYAGHADPAPELKWEGPAHQGVRKGLLSAFPRWNTHETWLRGAWPTNSNGVSQFTSIFPGYYTGRATHVHMKIVPEWTTNENGTYNIGRLVHTGQLFVPDEINEVVDKVHPYTTNPIKDKWGRTRNWDDSLNIYDLSHQNGHQPTFEIHKIGGVVQMGMIGYATVGVDLNADYDRTSTQQKFGVKHAA